MGTNSFKRYIAPHSITFTNNGRSHSYPIHPIFFSVSIGFLIFLSTGYFIATGYLIFRDNLIITRNTRNTQIIQEYEYRISNLRMNLDRVKSQQIMDQKLVESRVNELIEGQKKLSDRKSALLPILKRASLFGVNASSEPEKSKKQSLMQHVSHNSFTFPYFNKKPFHQESIASPNPVKGSKILDNLLLPALTVSIQNINADQEKTVSFLHTSVNEKLKKINRLMQNIGVKVPLPSSRSPHKKIRKQIGGPFKPIGRLDKFSLKLKALNHSLDSLAFIRKKMKNLPLVNPAPGKSISSGFGPRPDPFKGKYAMHSGLDFRTAAGSAVYAAANGKVTFAGRKGSYGNMIEIDHGNGYSTRYAHLNRILLKAGEGVRAGSRIGKTGNTGRSTGAHLHYEVRFHGKAVNPIKYLSTGRKVLNIMAEKKKS